MLMLQRLIYSWVGPLLELFMTKLVVNEAWEFRLLVLIVDLNVKKVLRTLLEIQLI